MSLETFCPLGRLVLGTFCPKDIKSEDIIQVSVCVMEILTVLFELQYMLYHLALLKRIVPVLCYNELLIVLLDKVRLIDRTAGMLSTSLLTLGIRQPVSSVSSS